MHAGSELHMGVCVRVCTHSHPILAVHLPCVPAPSSYRPVHCLPYTHALRSRRPLA